MAKAKLSEEMYDKVIEQVLVLDRSVSLAARTLCLDDTTAGRIVKTFQLVKAGDWDSIIEQINTGKTNPRHIEYAANKVGLSIPDEVYQAHEAYCDMIKCKRIKKDAPAKPIERPVTTIERPVTNKANDDANTAFYLTTLLAEVKRQNELLEQLMDTVLPKLINTNADLISERISKCEQFLDNIKYNTRGLKKNDRT